MATIKAVTPVKPVVVVKPLVTKPPVVVKPTVVKPVTPVDPTKLTGTAERNYRQLNPNSDYTKSVDTKYINTISNSMKNNTGVTSAQLNDYNARLQKWNMKDPNAPKPFDQNAFLSDMQGQINGLYDSQQQSQLAALKASQDKAVGQLNQQKAEIAPQYQSDRNQADVVNTQNVQRLRELMASNGLQASGENVTAQTAQNNQRQNSLNTLNLQEQQANNDINRQINDATDPAQQQALIAQLSAQRSQALIDASNRANDTGYQRQQDGVQNAMAAAGITGKYNGQDTFAAQQAAIQNAYNQANLTGKYNGQNTMAYNQMVANLTGKYNGQSTYQAQQDTKNNAMNEANLTGKYNGKDTLAAKQQAADNNWRTYQYSNMSATDKAQLAQNASQFGEDKAWQMFQLKYNGELQKSTNQAQINAYTP